MTPIPLRGRRPGVRSRPASSALGTALRELRRALFWHRRLIAGVLAAIAVLAALETLRPDTAAGISVVTAAHDLPAGAVLRAGDLRVAQLPTGLAPVGASASLAGVLGAELASPVRSGEVVTDVRLVGPALLTAYRSDVGADAGEWVLRVDASTVAVLRPGDRVDVLAAPTAGPGAGGPAVLIAAAVPVLAVPGAAGSTAAAPLGATSGEAAADDGSVLVVVTPATARLLARAAVSSQLSVLVHPG